MKIDLIPFQQRAVEDLRLDVADALESYRRRKKTQVVSLQAPTGSGKTIIAASLIEDIFCGSTLSNGTVFGEQPNAVFVWLSDSPELNEQSKQKIELKTSKLRFGQCVTISEDNFDMEMLEDGCIYFLNTQKIGRSGKLTKHYDGRQYTIWETLENTVRNKSDRFYFIIDEAHRGAKSVRDAGRDTTIMQRFIMGYDVSENGYRRKMSSMPVVIGISATAERFETLVSRTANIGLQRCVISAEDVRSSGLLKDRIVITYPKDPERENDFVVLEAAVDEWVKKCKRWYQYTYEQHRANVDPVFVVQVRQGRGRGISETNIQDVLEKIEERSGISFKFGEVVHCFGDSAALELNGLKIPHVNASDIADDHKIKVVFFKEALSTGWDCPRAETMMSFAVRNDPTYIAQLLGRMVRTPLQMRVTRDEFLNDVKLYLPHFDKDTVKSVVDELQSNEGGEIPTEVDGESLEEPSYVIWTIHTPRRVRQFIPDANQMDFGDLSRQNGEGQSDAGEYADLSTPTVPQGGNCAPEYIPTENAPRVAVGQTGDSADAHDMPQIMQLSFTTEIDRADIVDFINSKAFLTYLIRRDRINDYLKSLLDMATLLTINLIDSEARNMVINDVLNLIRSYVEQLHDSGEYQTLAEQVLQFKLSVQVFDPFGVVIAQNYATDLTMMSETDIDRQLKNADAKLGRFGFPILYGKKYFDENDPNAFKIDCILFAADDSCLEKLGEYAKAKLYEFVRKYRLNIVSRSDSCKKKYHDILADADVVSEQIFSIPENIVLKEDVNGKEYDDHLLASSETGIAKIKLNGWEEELIEEESKRSDFVCWLRNPTNAPWALCLYYEMGGEIKKFYPDFLIVRSNPQLKYIIDILEPHGQQYADNLPKAKGLADYAQKENRFGRIELIHKNERGRFVRLDLTDPEINEKVRLAHNDDDLNYIFRTYASL